jgi:hypothetical protein
MFSSVAHMVARCCSTMAAGHNCAQDGRDAEPWIGMLTCSSRMLPDDSCCSL